MSIPTLTIQEPQNNIIETFENAFRSKVGSEVKPIESHKWVKQDKYMLHQTYPIGTWFVDLVKFGDYWYVFFVEACSRYLVVIQGNSNFINNESTEISSGRVSAVKFKEAFQEFERINTPHDIKLLIGDTEKAFWSGVMMNYYKSQHIATKTINTVQDGHLGLSILDRLVKTIRDMCFKLEYSETVQPVDMINVVITYNNTFHSTLTRMLKRRISPLEVHESEELQEKFNERLVLDNLLRRLQRKFIIPIGVEVVVRRKIFRKFEKVRSIVMPGKWYVVGYNSKGFKVKNPETEEVLQDVPRSHLRPIYHY